MIHRNARVAYVATALIVACVLSACSADDGNEPSGVTFSPAVESIPSVESPIAEADLLPKGSRPVAYIESVDAVTVLSLGSNACGVVVTTPESGTEAMSVDLKSEPKSQIKRSNELGEYAEAGIEPAHSEWVLRCGSVGVQICGVPLSESTKIVGLVETDTGDCLSLAEGR